MLGKVAGCLQLYKQESFNAGQLYVGLSRSTSLSSLSIIGKIHPDYVKENPGILRGMLEKIPGNVTKNSGECSRGFRRMLLKIPGNLNFDLFLETLLVFYQILLLNCFKTMEKNNC